MDAAPPPGTPDATTRGPAASWLVRILHRLFEPDPTHDVDTRRRVLMLHIVTGIGLLNLVPLGFAAWREGNAALGICDHAFAVVLATLLWRLRRTGDYLPAALTGVTLGACLFIYLFVTGGVHGTGHVWYFTFPLLASFLLGSKRGALASGLLLVPALLVLFTDLGSAIGAYPYSSSFAIRFVPAWIVVSVYSYAFERLREKTQRGLMATNEELVDAVDALHQKEKALAAAHDRLEARVRERTWELDQANRNLLQEVRIRRSAEEALQASHDRFLTVLDSIDANVYVADMDDYKLLFVNRHMQETFGPGSPGQPCHEVIFNREAPCADCTNPRLRSEAGVSGDGAVDTWEGWNPVARQWCIHHTRAVRWVDGRLVRIQISTDLTKRRAAEEENARLQAELVHAQKMEALGTLAGGVAHDLNNILSGVIAYPDLLLLDLSPDSPMRHHLEAIRSSGERCAHIVQDLLALSRRSATHAGAVDLNALVAAGMRGPEITDLCRRHPSVELRSALASTLPPVHGTGHNLGQVLLNLLVNAFEAMPEGGKLSVRTEQCHLKAPVRGYVTVPPGDYVTLTVEDSGIGIPSASVRRIFEPFYSTKKLGRSGSGLGMAVVWATVEDHEGYIDVRTEEGAGTAFTIYLRTEQGLAEVVEDAIPVDYRGRGETLLVVDDEEQQRDLARMILTKLGYVVTAVPSGEEAVRWLAQEQADLVVLDMIMPPGMDGLETWLQIRELRPEQHALIVSGYAETRRVQEAMREGVRGYLAKPYLIRDLGTAVRSALEEPSRPPATSVEVP